MSSRRSDAADMLGFQLSSRPMRNEAVRAETTEDGALQLTVPLRRRGWARALGRVLPLSEERTVELDELGARVLERCDGERTVEDFIDWFQDRWKLSFFEARGLVLYFLRQLMQRGLIAMSAPPDARAEPDDR